MQDKEKEKNYQDNHKSLPRKRDSVLSTDPLARPPF
jgi:hypothetical protein